MRKRKFLYLKRLILPAVICFMLISLQALGQVPPKQVSDQDLVRDVEDKISEIMKEGRIPGLNAIVMREGRVLMNKGFGFADLEKKTPVTSGTYFELASCSKAYTALAALALEKEGKISLDDPITKYIPNFSVIFEGKEYHPTIRQFLYQTSGFEFYDIAELPPGAGKDALKEAVEVFNGKESQHMPGTNHQYSTVNYNVVARVIEVASGLTFEDYLTNHVLKPLGLNNTSVGVKKDNPPAGMAQGYKISFSSPRAYEPPIFRANNAAGYVISNGKDMERWLKLQMGLEANEFADLISRTHIGDPSVPPNLMRLASYGMGWYVPIMGKGLVFHSGLNPTFSTFIRLNATTGYAVALMTNSGLGEPTEALGNRIAAILDSKKIDKEYEYENSIDKVAAVVFYISIVILLFILGFLILVIKNIITGKRSFEAQTLVSIIKMLAMPLVFVPFLFGVYLVPRAMTDGGSWAFVSVWTPSSITIMGYSLLAVFALGYLGYIISVLFPPKNPYFRSAPLLVILSLVNGGANAVVIFLLHTSLYSPIKLQYLLYFFGLALVVYISGSKVVQTKLIKLTMDIVYDLRIKLIDKIFLTSYQKFEKMDRGRVYATLNDDTGQIGNSASLFVALISSIVTTIGCFMYLATIAFWATVVTILIIWTIAALYYFVGKQAEVYMEEARDTRNVYMGLLNGMLDGFKELSLHIRKKKEYKGDVEASCDEFRVKQSVAMIKFVNAFLVGESMLIAVLGAVGFGIPKLFPDIRTTTLMGFILVLLYMIGPINGILHSIPTVLQMKISWTRVKEFLKDIPANIDPKDIEALGEKKTDIQEVSAKGILFQYESESEDETGFSVGPLDFEAKKGEVIFIVGGNGSGKTTLAKLLTGLYIPDEGTLKVDGKEVSNYELGEYYSSVFSGFHLFEKLYNIDLETKSQEAMEYLKLLHMEKKVEIKDGRFTTINLSGGQKKRLALIQCYLEDCPIYIFDELAADQDPQFRKFFYRDLLQKMRDKGKIVIAVTHDDHYFDVADRIIKMDMGKVDKMEAHEYSKVTS
ncbi:MAG: cyclic peptide export ABC transporter [bacterium]|nr:cyclic peptide export ABC transporter [bacterium]